MPRPASCSTKSLRRRNGPTPDRGTGQWLTADYEVGLRQAADRNIGSRRGSSGNPRGRKSRKLNEAELVAKVRDELITMTINGKTRANHRFEAALRKTYIAVLAKGTVRDLEKLLQLYARFGAEPEAQRIAQIRKLPTRLSTLSTISSTRPGKVGEILFALRAKPPPMTMLRTSESCPTHRDGLERLRRGRGVSWRDR